MTHPNCLVTGDRITLLDMPFDPDPIPTGTAGRVIKVRPAGPDALQAEIAWAIDRGLMLTFPGDRVIVTSRLYLSYDHDTIIRPVTPPADQPVDPHGYGGIFAEEVNALGDGDGKPTWWIPTEFKLMDTPEPAGELGCECPFCRQRREAIAEVSQQRKQTMTKDVYISAYTAHGERVWVLIEMGGAACRPLPLADVIRLANQRWPNREFLPFWDGDSETWESEISLSETHS